MWICEPGRLPYQYTLWDALGDLVLVLLEMVGSFVLGFVFGSLVILDLT